MKKAIFITFYNREKILLKNLKYLQNCRNYNEYKKLIVCQDADNKTINKIKKIDSSIKILKTNYSKEYSIYSKVNNNIYKGFTYCFNVFKCDMAIHMEDDITPAYDFLIFVEFIMNKFKDDKKFFAVNGFSKEFKNDEKFTYSKFIYGIGKGWCVSKNNFKIIKHQFKKILKKNITRFFDVHLEFLIKKNYFVIMPYRSRTLEQISSGLTMKESFKSSIFYKNWKKSFLGNRNFIIKKYIYKNTIEYNWRYDCLKLSKINKVKSIIFYFFTKIYYLIIKLSKSV